MSGFAAKNADFYPSKTFPSPKMELGSSSSASLFSKMPILLQNEDFYPSARIFEAKKGWIGFLKRRFWVKIGVFLHSEGSSQLQNGGFQPQNGGSGEEPQLCAPKSAFFTSKSPLCLWNSLFLISIFFLIGQMGDFCPKKRRFRPRNLRFFPPQCCFLCFKNPFLPPKIYFNPKTVAFTPKVGFLFFSKCPFLSGNRRFQPQIRLFVSADRISCALKGLFPPQTQIFVLPKASNWSF